MSANSIRLAPGCKVNLFLEILCHRDDGYHELETLFWPLAAPSDELLVRPGPAGTGLTFTCSAPELAGPDNLVVKAYGLFTLASERQLDVAVHLDKRVPMGAGLGGGSADAAAMLQALNALAGDGALSSSVLTSLATQLGADVPFFLQQRPCLARGIGEELTPVALDLSAFTMVLCCPNISVSTAWAYGAWDALQEKSALGNILHLTDKSHADKDIIFTDAVVLFNSFEKVVLPRESRLTALKELAYKAGAAGALMTGSGSSVFALFREASSAEGFARQAEALDWIGPRRVFSSHM